MNIIIQSYFFTKQLAFTLKLTSLFVHFYLFKKRLEALYEGLSLTTAMPNTETCDTFQHEKDMVKMCTAALDM